MTDNFAKNDGRRVMHLFVRACHDLDSEGICVMQGHPSLVLRKLSGLTGGSGSVDAAKRSHSLGEDERGNHDKGVGMVAAMRNLRAVVLRNSRCLGEATSRRTRGARSVVQLKDFSGCPMISQKNDGRRGMHLFVRA